MENIRYEIADKPKRFLQIWKSFREFLEGDHGIEHVGHMF